MNNEKNNGPGKNEPKKPEVRTRQEPRIDIAEFKEVKDSAASSSSPRINSGSTEKKTSVHSGGWMDALKKWGNTIGEKIWERSRKIMSAVGFTVAWLLWGVFLSQADTRNVINKTVSNTWNALWKKETVFTKEQGLKKENAEFQKQAMAAVPATTLPFVKEKEKSLMVIDTKPKIAYTLEWIPVAVSNTLDGFKKPMEMQLAQAIGIDEKRKIAEDNQRNIESKLKVLLELQWKKPILKNEGLPVKIANYEFLFKKQEKSMRILDNKIASARDQKLAKVIEGKTLSSGSSKTWTSASGSAKTELKIPQTTESKTAERPKSKMTKSKTLKKLSYASLKKLVSEADVAGGKYSLVEMSKWVYRVYFITDNGRKFYFTPNLPSNRRFLSEDGIISWGEKKAEIARWGKESSENSLEKKSPELTKESGESQEKKMETQQKPVESKVAPEGNSSEEKITEYSSSNEQYIDPRLWKNKSLLDDVRPIVWPN